jgi:hypothetical protein
MTVESSLPSHCQLNSLAATSNWYGIWIVFVWYCAAKGLFGYVLLKFNSHHINVPLNAWSTKYRLIACMSTHIRSNLRDESIKSN